MTTKEQYKARVRQILDDVVGELGMAPEPDRELIRKVKSLMEDANLEKDK